jgi:hypothetical protein
MTPEESKKLDELYDWMKEKKVQQISYPADDASLSTLGITTILNTALLKKITRKHHKDAGLHRF